MNDVESVTNILGVNGYFGGGVFGLVAYFELTRARCLSVVCWPMVYERVLEERGEFK